MASTRWMMLLYVYLLYSRAKIRISVEFQKSLLIPVSGSVHSYQRLFITPLFKQSSPSLILPPWGAGVRKYSMVDAFVGSLYVSLEKIFITEVFVDHFI